MKFGKSIGEQQEGHGSLHYVDYKLLKRKIKEVSAHLLDRQLAEALTANTGFEEELAGQIQKVNGCFSRRQAELLEGTSTLAEELQRKGQANAAASSSSSAAGPAIQAAPEGPAPPVPPASLQRLVELLTGVDELRKYAVWNAVAIVKILKKRRKQTNFGLEDSSAERAGWLSRQTFFNGSDFAELHTAIESLGHALVLSEFSQGEGGMRRPVPSAEGQPPEQCPICLNTISDMVELGCKHRFCWKCFVLGPIAFQPGEYQITQCPICRRDTAPVNSESAAADSLEGSPNIFSSQGILTRFLHTYFPPQDDKDGDALEDREMQDVVGDLVKVVLADSNWQQPSKVSAEAEGGASASSGPAAPRDFFETLPPRPTQDKQPMYAAQKLQWLQLASNDDPLALDSAMCCSLCSEPLLMEAVVTTPCKHHFHRVCVGRLDMPACPLCTTALPFSWFLPPSHPFAERGFRVVPMHAYRPRFPGGPGVNSGGYPLQKPPPVSLLGAGGLAMTSYLHRIVPMGSGEDSHEGTPRSSGSGPPRWRKGERGGDGPEGDSSNTEDSSAESDSEEDDDGSGAEEQGVAGGRPPPPEDGGIRRKPRSHAWVHSAMGKMRLYRQQDAHPAAEPPRPSFAAQFRSAASGLGLAA